MTDQAGHIELRPARGIKRSFDESTSGANDNMPNLCRGPARPSSNFEIGETIQAPNPVSSLEGDHEGQLHMTKQLSGPMSVEDIANPWQSTGKNAVICLRHL
jgi:hypothetical protein